MGKVWFPGSMFFLKIFSTLHLWVVLQVCQESLLPLNGIWIEDFTDTFLNGRTYTLNYTENINPAWRTSQMILVLYHHFSYYKIYIHDPNYFIINYSPDLPTIGDFDFNPNETAPFFKRLALTEVEELDLAEDPCNTDPDYNFQACVRESLSGKVGCRTKWDRWTSKDVLLCTTIPQYRCLLISLKT